jgi:hypothetical protein
VLRLRLAVAKTRGNRHQLSGGARIVRSGRSPPAGVISNDQPVRQPVRRLPGSRERLQSPLLPAEIQLDAVRGGMLILHKAWRNMEMTREAAGARRHPAGRPEPLKRFRAV